MIAEILKAFESNALSRKIDYQIKKIESGVARELYNSVGDTIYNMYRNMTLVAELNERVKLPYIEFVLSSPVGESLPDELFIEIAQKYMKQMKYDEACYTIIKNEDKEHQHIHILTTTVDLNGLKISDSRNWERSNKIMRELEKEYGLQITEKGKSVHNKTLGESQYREYFFDTALKKSLRSHNAHERISRLLESSDTFINLGLDMKKAYTNNEWRVILGEDIYNNIFETLSKSKFFNPLFKDELLSVMDRVYKDCKNIQGFRNKLEEEGYYMRLITDKGKSYYVYGIPDRSFYIKDSALPERYRFGKIAFAGENMAVDEQKHYLYNQIFATLNSSSSYEDFKEQLTERNINLTEYANVKGVYGVSFKMMNVDSPYTFKGSDVSRRLTYQNIYDYFQKTPDAIDVRHPESMETKPIDIRQPESMEVQTSKQINVSESEQVKGGKNIIEPIVICYVDNKKEWDKDINYMYPAMMLSNIFDDAPGKKRKSEDDLLDKKKKKKRKGLSL